MKEINDLVAEMEAMVSVSRKQVEHLDHLCTMVKRNASQASVYVQSLNNLVEGKENE